MDALGFAAVMALLILGIILIGWIALHIRSISYISRSLQEDWKKIAILVGIHGLIIFVIIKYIFFYIGGLYW